MDMLSGMRLFAEVVKANGFAAAGRQHGMAPSTVSRQISALEQALGTRLLNRNTRKVSLTEAGTLYFEQATRILSDLDDANRAVLEFEGSPRGTLRLTTSAAFGRLHVTPALSQFLQRYPDLSVELIATDETVDLVETGIDVAIRMGVLQNSSLVARKLGSNEYVICASAAYFERHPAPQKPSDLADHNCLIHKPSASPAIWTFRRAQDTERVEVSGNLLANSFGVIKAAACLSQGIALVPTWSAMPCVAGGYLQPVLPEYRAYPGEREDNGGIYLVYPHRQLVSPKVRAFVDFMIEYVGSPPYWTLR